MSSASRAPAGTDNRGGLIAGLAGVLNDYGRAWLGYALSALVVASITSGIYRIPLWQVVDVTLALLLFFVALFASLTTMGFIIDLVGGEIRTALVRLFGLLLLVFLPFGAISGYAVYGWWSGAEVAGASFVQDGFTELFAHAYVLAAGQVGDVLHVMAKPADGSPAVPDITALVQLASAASVTLGLLGLLAGRLRLATTVDTLGASPFSAWRAATLPARR